MKVSNHDKEVAVQVMTDYAEGRIDSVFVAYKQVLEQTRNEELAAWVLFKCNG